MLETTPDEHVSATLNTALMGAAFHWASGASFEVRSPLIALDCACLRLIEWPPLGERRELRGGVPAHGSELHASAHYGAFSPHRWRASTQIYPRATWCASSREPRSCAKRCARGGAAARRRAAGRLHASAHRGALLSPQVRAAARLLGDALLAKKLDELLAAIRRDLVAAPSLYTTGGMAGW